MVHAQLHTDTHIHNIAKSSHTHTNTYAHTCTRTYIHAHTGQKSTASAPPKCNARVIAGGRLRAKIVQLNEQLKGTTVCSVSALAVAVSLTRFVSTSWCDHWNGMTVSLLCASMPLVSLLCASVPLVSLLCASMPLVSWLCASMPLVSLLCASMPLVSLLCASMPLGLALYCGFTNACMHLN